MALGDGANWDETVPVDGTIVLQIDDYDRDLRVGVRSRMAFEHEWPSSQTATNEGGKHKFITLQEQAAKPTVSGTQLGALYVKTVGAGLQEVFFEDESGNEIQITSGTGVIGPTGGSVQFLATNTGAVFSCATVVPKDDSIPQITEGIAVLTQAITPLTATNNFDIEAGCMVSATNAADNITAAIFIDTTANALSCISLYAFDNNALYNLHLSHKMSAGTTAARTLYLRVGGSAGGVTINGIGGTRQFGGVGSAYLKVRETKV